MKKLNLKIEKYLKKQKNTNYIDITKAMNDENGKVITDHYLEDMHHIKPERYKIWEKIMSPYIK
jgi:hypothetical protein